MDMDATDTIALVHVRGVCARVHAIKLEAKWIPHFQNEKADFVSRIIDHDDWSLDPFQVIDASWGRHTVDCFASQHNTLLPRFHSRFWVPSCEAVDTFTTNWSSELNWWLPPLHLVFRTIIYMLYHVKQRIHLLYPHGSLPHTGLLSALMVGILLDLCIYGGQSNFIEGYFRLEEHWQLINR